MPLALYMDVHVPAAITEGLRRRRLDILTSQEDGTREFDDERLLQRVLESGRLLFTQDADFLIIATIWQQAARKFPGIIFSSQDQTAIGRTVDELELVLSCYEADEVENRIIFLPLR